MPVIECNKVCDWFEEAHQFLLTIGQRRLVILSGSLAWSNSIATSFDLMINTVAAKSFAGKHGAVIFR